MTFLLLFGIFIQKTCDAFLLNFQFILPQKVQSQKLTKFDILNWKYIIYFWSVVSLFWTDLCVSILFLKFFSWRFHFTHFSSLDFAVCAHSQTALNLSRLHIFWLVLWKKLGKKILFYTLLFLKSLTLPTTFYKWKFLNNSKFF